MIVFEGEIFDFRSLDGVSKATGKPYQGAEYKMREINSAGTYPETLVFNVFNEAFMNAKIKPGQYGKVTLRHNINMSADGRFASLKLHFVSWELLNKPITPTKGKGDKSSNSETKGEDKLPF